MPSTVVVPGVATPSHKIVRRTLTQQSRDDFTWLAIQQRLIPSILFVRQLIGGNTEQVEQRGVVIKVVNHVLDGAMAKFVGGTISSSRSETATCYPHAKAVGIVVAAEGLDTGVVLNHR